MTTATLQRRLRPSSTDRAFSTLVAATEGRVRALVDRLVSGDLAPHEWEDAMLTTLAEGHAQAGYRGRLRAGDTAPYDRDDQRFGALVAQEEAQFLWGFTRDIEAGRYGVEEPETERIQRRALMYVSRLYGTANEALALVAGDDELWHWKTAPGETCADCLRLEANSPYRGQPPTMPRQSETACLSNCHCVAYTTGGLETFAP